MSPEHSFPIHWSSRLLHFVLVGLLTAVVSSCDGAIPIAPTLPPDTTHIVVTSVVLTNDPNVDLPKPDGTLQTALQRLQKAHGFHFVYNFNTTKLVGDATGLTQNYHYKVTTIDGKDTAVSKIGEWLVINNPDTQQQLVYIKQADNWVSKELASADQTYSFVILTIFGNATSTIATPQNYTRTNADMIEGQLCDHYININATPSNTHEVWVSQTTGEVTQIVETSQKSASTNDLNHIAVVFSNVNQPIIINAPH